MTVYEDLGGYQRVRELAGAWHEQCLADEVMSHPFSHPGAHDHLDRLASYWSEQLGGPPLYSGVFGDETSVLRMHSGNGAHEEMNGRAVHCFLLALDDVGLFEPTLRVQLQAWFVYETAQMSHFPRSPDDVPDGLPLPIWTGGAPA